MKTTKRGRIKREETHEGGTIVVKRRAIRMKRIFVKREKKTRGVIERIDRSKLIGRAKYNKTDDKYATYVDYLN